MESLKAILKGFVVIRSNAILEIQLVLISLCDLINKLADKERHEFVEGVFLVAHVVVAKNLLKSIDNAILTAKRAEVFLVETP